MKKMVMVLGLLHIGCLMAEPTVISLIAQQRYPWNGLVDITVTFAGSLKEVSQAECSFVATNSATRMALSVVHIIREGNVDGSGNKWIRRFTWDAAADIGSVSVDDIALTVRVSLGIQLWKNGPYWAECNVGASKPEEYGHYFWWGDIVGYVRNGGTWSGVNHYYSGVTWVSSKGVRMNSSPFTEVECPTYGKNEKELQISGYTDSTGNLVSTCDAATVQLGAPWRMPTHEEWRSLGVNCTLSLVTTNGVHGLLVNGKGSYASKRIFLPSAGYGRNSGLLNPELWGCYWSSTSFFDGNNAHSFLFYEGNLYQEVYYLDRYLGKSIRPLRDFSTVAASRTKLGFQN